MIDNSQQKVLEKQPSGTVREPCAVPRCPAACPAGAAWSLARYEMCWRACLQRPYRNPLLYDAVSFHFCGLSPKTAYVEDLKVEWNEGSVGKPEQSACRWRP